MLIEIILVIIFTSICIGDCYSTAKLLRHNHKMFTDTKYANKVRGILRKKMKADESTAEMCPLTGKLVRRFGGDRAMLYVGLFGYGPLSIALLYLLLTEGIETLILTAFLIGLMFGMLFMQILKALTLKRRFGVDVWKE